MMLATFLLILGGLAAIILLLVLLWLVIDFIARFVLSVIMIRQWRREEQR